MITNVIFGEIIELIKSGKYDAFAHGCNCKSTMGSGIAVPIKNNFQDLYRADKVEGGLLKLGGFTHAITKVVSKSGSRVVGFNAYTQYDYSGRNKVSYLAIFQVFQKIAVAMHYAGLKTLLIPAIGGDLGGGDWSKIARIIDSATENLIDVHVVIWDKEKNKELIDYKNNFVFAGGSFEKLSASEIMDMYSDREKTVDIFKEYI